jgi:hypothetical protein
MQKAEVSKYLGTVSEVEDPPDPAEPALLQRHRLRASAPGPEQYDRRERKKSRSYRIAAVCGRRLILGDVL